MVGAVLVALLPACSGFGGANDLLPEQAVVAATGDMLPDDRGVASNSAAADWGCLGAPPAAAPGITGAGNVRYSVPVSSMFGLPLTNAVARVCAAADVNCASPLSEVRGLTPEGLLEVEVPVAYAGFLEFEADAHAPSVFHMRKPVYKDTVDLVPFQPIPAAGVTQLAGLLSIEVVPELAIVSVAALDCRGERAPGVAFSNDLGGREFYFIDGLPNVMVDATGVQGQGGFVNVPLRLVQISAEVEADGQLIGTRTILPRVGWIVGVTVRPPALPLD